MVGIFNAEASSSATLIATANIMGTPRPRFLLTLVLVASLNLLAVFAALPPDGYLDASEPALEQAYDPRALLVADSDASLESVTESVDSIDSVDFEESEDPRVLLAMGDVAADLKQTSDVASGTVKKAIGQAGRNVRNSVGSMMGVAPKKGKKKHRRHRHRGGKKTGTAGAGKRNSGAAPKVSAAGKRKSGAAAPKTPAAPAAGAKGVPKKQAGSNPDAASKPSAAPAAGAAAVPKQEAGAKDTSGAAPKAPAAASEPRALLEAADSDAALIDSVDFASVDSVDSEDSRMLLTMGNAAADLKQLSDDASGAVKNALGQAGRKVRNSVGSMMGVPPKKGKKKHRRHRHRGGRKTGPAGAGKRNSGAAPKAPAAGKRNSGAAAPKTPVSPAAGASGVPKKQAGGKVNSGAAAKTPVAPTVGTAAVPKEQAPGAKATSDAAPKPTAATAAPKPPTATPASAASSAAPGI
ncbi:unnamed protein product [Closterium sp. NIES-64]|nr:unnamed protein product [Closterium sp. NIES-64]CAI6010784.1 unnamed protein product [Closterium sp. NIES-65]